MAGKTCICLGCPSSENAISELTSGVGHGVDLTRVGLEKAPLHEPLDQKRMTLFDALDVGDTVRVAEAIDDLCQRDVLGGDNFGQFPWMHHHTQSILRRRSTLYLIQDELLKQC